MKNISFTLLAIIAFTFAGFSQSYNANLTFEKKKQQALAIDFAFSSTAVQNAFVSKMERLGYKGKEEKGLFNKDKGVIIFKSAYVSSISTKPLDFIVKVDSRGKKDDAATLTLLVMDPSANSNAIISLVPEEVYRIKDFLNNMQPDVVAANLELQIKAQEDVLGKAEKKLKKLQDDKIDLGDKIKKLQDDVKKNEQDQVSSQSDIDTQRSALETLRSRRVAQ